MLNSLSLGEPILEFEQLVMQADKSDSNVVISSPWNWWLNPGDRLSVMTTNSFLNYQLIATLADLVKPVSGEIVKRGTVSWPLGGQGGLHSSLTISNGYEFISSIYSDSLEKSQISPDDFFDALKSQLIDVYTPLKNLDKAQNNFFFAALSILFSFDICIAPHSKDVAYLMSRQAKPLRNLLRKQLDGGLCLISTSKINRFKREFCNRGMVLGPLGEVMFDGDLEDAIAFSGQNDTVDNSSEADDSQFDYGEALTNSSESQSYDL